MSLITRLAMLERRRAVTEQPAVLLTDAQRDKLALHFIRTYIREGPAALAAKLARFPEADAATVARVVAEVGAYVARLEERARLMELDG